MLDTNLLEDQPIAWTPTPEVIERAQLTKFMKQVGVSTWDELYQFSIADVEKFTEEVLKFLDIKFDPPYEKLLDTSNGVEFPTWFSRSADTPVRLTTNEEADKSVRAPAGLNITEMCLDRWQTDEMKDQPALVWEGEDGQSTTFSYVQVMDNVVACVNMLSDRGLKKGDAVGIHLPMLPETVVAMLAINRIGAIAVPVFSGYGIDAITSRMDAVGAKALITCFGTTRRGKALDMVTVAARAIANVPSIESVILVGGKGISELGIEGFVKEQNRLQEDVFGGRTVSQWKVNGNLFDLLDNNPPVKTSAEDPLIILYTSGTTGKPKGIAHTHASFPIKAAQDMAFGTDVGRGTRICWYTDIGWMMGPWLIYGALINGATICIYDGAPDYPTPDRMWEFCAKHKVEVLGISPTLVRSLSANERSADTPVRMSAEHEDALSAIEDGDKNVPVPVLVPRKGWYRQGHLPHFDANVTQFITFRLADSLPRSVVEQLRLQLEQDQPEERSEEYRQKIEGYLDSGAGECILKNPAIAEIVKFTILYEHRRSCELKAWVIMPNHVHILLRLREGYDLAGLMKRIKGVSSRKINRRLGTIGRVWQADYFDRYIRDWEHFVETRIYIENNPVVAGLCSAPEDWEFGSAARSADTLVRDEHETGVFAAGGDADKSERAPLPAPFERHDLSSLRLFASTGEPWNPAPWWWLFEKVGNSKLPIINYSGGTEISGGILMGNPLLPQKPCSFPAPCPGMDVDILDENGESVEPGKVGELVIKQPWIGIARGFWQERERYLDTYWRRFKNIWVHGDWAMRDVDGHWFILGRSDDTLKIAGKRVGPAEVESLLVAHPLVIEAAVVGVPDEVKGTAMVAFCVLTGAQASPLATPDTALRSAASANHDVTASGTLALQSELKSLVARDMGKPLAPSRIHFVSALPKTRNAKVMRRVIRAAYLGDDPGDLSALENPATVEELQNIGR